MILIRYHLDFDINSGFSKSWINRFYCLSLPAKKAISIQKHFVYKLYLLMFKILKILNQFAFFVKYAIACWDEEHSRAF